MKYITQALTCISPCIMPVLAFIGCIIHLRYIRYRMIFRGPMPSDGEVDGFASKEARIEFFSTNDQRFKETVKAIVIWVIVGIVASLIFYFASHYNVSTK